MSLNKLHDATANMADWVEFEIASYRKGYILLRFDFVRRVLIWKDSNRWFNDFVRSLPEDKTESLHQALSRFAEETPPDTGDVCLRPAWRVRWGSGDCGQPSAERAGDAGNRAWLDLSRVVEAASQRYLEF